jgi:beta-galactosidase/beta-glucuronidase
MRAPGWIGVVAALALSILGARGDEPWKPAAAPLMTRWAADVSPEHARPEYPRPLLVRKDWKSLNGIWQFAFDDAAEGQAAGWSSGKAFPNRILVPFSFEAALSGIGKGKEIHEQVWYRRGFEVPASWRGRRVVLNFGASDWETTVWVNGHRVISHRGGYTPFSADVTDALKPAQEQEIVAAIYDPADPHKAGWQPKGKQLGSSGIWYTRTTGIWQSVWLEPVASYHIDGIAVSPSLSPDGRSGSIVATVQTAGGGPVHDSEVSVELSSPGRTVHENIKMTGGALENPSVSLAVPDPKLWTPETPNLYDLKVTLRRDGKTVDEVRSYCALRTVGIANGRLTLNGKPYFYRGVLDQGFWPDGVYTAPTDAALRADVEAIKKLGFNMARKHVKVEDPRYYYWCDHLGVAVWQDMPSSHNLGSDEARQNFEQEWKAEVADLRNYPCVVHWIPFNENWGDPKDYQDHIVMLTRALDPSRPITDASGWTQRSLTDVIDVHDYGNNLLRQGVKNPVKPKVVGEYGGIALPVPGHTWTTGWGYQTVRDPEGLVRKVRAQTSQLFEAENLSGFVYTQLTDVEQELNGLLTYDRHFKAPPRQIAPVFEGADRVRREGQ